MKLGHFEVMNVNVYNTDGNLVTSLDSLKYHRFHKDESGYHLYIEDALFDTDMLAFMQYSEENEQNYRNNTDWEKAINSLNPHPIEIQFKSDSKKRPCMLKCDGIMRSFNTGADIPYYLIIPSALVCNNFEFDGDPDRRPTIFQWDFWVKPEDIGKMIMRIQR